MTKVLIYINIIATLLLLFAGFDQVLSWGMIANKTGLVFVIFTSATFLLITTFLQITMKDE